MSLTIVTAVCGANPITEQFMHHTLGRCSVRPELVVVANGSTADENEELREWFDIFSKRWAHGGEFKLVVRKEPLGSTKAFNLGVSKATGDVVALLHNDLLVRQDNWDQWVLQWFAEHPETGVVGFHGSQALGAPNLYEVPYELTQLARTDNYSNLEDAESHGYRKNYPLEVVTLDGMSLIARRQDFLDWGGLEETYVHHMYDHDLCLTARKAGRINYMLPIIAKHISGQTANADRYNEKFAEQGRDAGIHAAAHEAFYKKWKGTGQLPARIQFSR